MDLREGNGHEPTKMLIIDLNERIVMSVDSSFLVHMCLLPDNPGGDMAL